MVVILIAVLIFLFSFLNSFSQGEEPFGEIIDYISNMENSIEIQEVLEYYFQMPINLLKATPDDLANLPFFDYATSQNVCNFIKNNPNKTYVDIRSELALSRIQALVLENCTFIPKEETKIAEPSSSKVNFRLRMEPTLGRVKGIEEKKFVGNSLSLYQRTNLDSDDYSLLLLFSKDVGERDYWDFITASFSTKIGGLGVIIGDFCFETMMGSIFSNNYFLSKSIADFSQMSKYANVIRQNRSRIEGSFFRGVAIRSDVVVDSNMRLNYSLFFSSKKLSASFDSTSNVITSIYKTGYYRTETELSKKDILNELACGGFLSLDWNFIKVGFSALYLDYSKEIRANSETDFRGKRGVLYSAGYQAKFPSILLVGELSVDATSNLGFKQGLELAFANTKLLFHYRNFSKGFRSPYGFNFGESSFPNNEIGLFSAFQTKISDGIFFKFYVDFFKTHTNTYSVPSVVRGIDIASEFFYKMDKTTELLIRLRFKEKTDCYTDSANLKRTFDKSCYNLRLQVNKRIYEYFDLCLRNDVIFLDYKGYKQNELGILILSELKTNCFSEFLVNFRLSYFSTPSYNSALWTVEPRILNSFVLSSMFDEGLKTYIIISYKLFNVAVISGKYSYLIKNDIDFLGSGLMKFYNNAVHTFIFQLDMKLPLN